MSALLEKRASMRALAMSQNGWTGRAPALPERYLPRSASWMEEMEKRSRRRIRDLVALTAIQVLSQNEIGCARISDGQEQKRSIQGPDTEAQDQPSPDHHFQLATHGRSIQKCQEQKFALQQIFLFDAVLYFILGLQYIRAEHRFHA